MTNEMHINGLKGIKPFLQQIMLKANYEGMGEIDKAEIGETIDAAIEALEKQIPQKPIADKELEVKTCKCPNCNYSLGYDFEHVLYCQFCGQALDWSDADET